MLIIKLLPLNSAPHFSALPFDSKTLRIYFLLPAGSLFESSSRNAGRRLRGWRKERGPACLLFLSASLWQTSSSFPYPANKLAYALQRWQHCQAPALPPGPSSEPLLCQHAAFQVAWLPAPRTPSQLASSSNTSFCLVSIAPCFCSPKVGSCFLLLLPLLPPFSVFAFLPV